MRIFFIGTGRLAVNLATAFRRSGIVLSGCYSRNSDHGKAFSERFHIPFFPQLTSIPVDCDVYLLAVTDSAVAEVSAQIQVDGILAHCSGMLPIETIHGNKIKGVFWPVQTLSLDHLVDLDEVPFCVEASSVKALQTLLNLANAISRQAMQVTLEERQRMHLAAVLVNNFSNHLFHLASQFLSTHGDTFEHLKPIITETARKVQTLDPAMAQTGPAVRHDLATLERHRQLLEVHPDLLKLYDTLSESILHTKKP